MKFRCWVPDEGYSRADAIDIEADSPAEAAEALAEQWYEGGDSFAQIDVAVSEWGSGTQEMFRVTVDFDPSFSAQPLP